MSTEPTEEQLLDALRQIKTEDVVVQTVATLVNLAGQKLSVEGAKDPAEAKKSIDAARHMLALIPDEAQTAVQNALDQIQMLYVRETSGEQPTGEQPTGEQPTGEQPPKEDEPPPPQSKIWTPGS